MSLKKIKPSTSNLIVTKNKKPTKKQQFSKAFKEDNKTNPINYTFITSSIQFLKNHCTCEEKGKM